MLVGQYVLDTSKALLVLASLMDFCAFVIDVSNALQFSTLSPQSLHALPPEMREPYTPGLR